MSLHCKWLTTGARPISAFRYVQTSSPVAFAGFIERHRHQALKDRQRTISSSSRSGAWSDSPWSSIASPLHWFPHRTSFGISMRRRKTSWKQSKMGIFWSDKKQGTFWEKNREPGEEILRAKTERRKKVGWELWGSEFSGEWAKPREWWSFMEYYDYGVSPEWGVVGSTEIVWGVSSSGCLHLDSNGVRICAE